MEDGALAASQTERSGNRDFATNPKSVHPPARSFWDAIEYLGTQEPDTASAFRKKTH